MKKIAILPTLLTLGNAVCGFAAISYAGKIGQADQAFSDEYYLALAGWLIIAAMIFDSLDGYVARLSRSASKFGGELDSLCDAISFGAAPAFVLLRLGPSWERPLWHQTLAVFATLYMVCAVLRLARFNVDSQPEVSGKKGFTGLPSPAAAGCIASLAILKGNLVLRFPNLNPMLVSEVIEAWAMIGSIFVALLMVSNVPYPKLTKRVLSGRRHFDHLILLVFGGFVLAVAIEIAPALVFWGYVFAILGQVAWMRATHAEPEVVPSLEK